MHAANRGVGLRFRFCKDAWVVKNETEGVGFQFV